MVVETLELQLKRAAALGWLLGVRIRGNYDMQWIFHIFIDDT